MHVTIAARRAATFFAWIRHGHYYDYDVMTFKTPQIVYLRLCVRIHISIRRVVGERFCDCDRRAEQRVQSATIAAQTLVWFAVQIRINFVLFGDHGSLIGANRANKQLQHN